MNSLLLFPLICIIALGAPLNETVKQQFIPPPPYVNGCFVVDPQHEVLIGPPINNTTPNYWTIFAYTLDVVLMIILAIFFRIHYIRNGENFGRGKIPSSNPTALRFTAAQSSIHL